MRRFARKWAVAFAFAALIQSALAIPAGAASPAEELLALANAERAAHGLAPLANVGHLEAPAARHAYRMAASGGIHHSSLRQYPGRFVGENVAVGSSVEGIHRALMDSPGHRANVLHPRFGQAGFAVIAVDGRVWAVEAFADSRHIATRSRLGRDSVRRCWTHRHRGGWRHTHCRRTR